MSLNFAPHPGAASLPAMIRAQTGIELRLLVRNGEQLLLALVIPLLLLIAGTHSGQVVDLEVGDPWPAHGESIGRRRRRPSG